MGGVDPQRRRQSTWGARILLFSGDWYTQCICMAWGISRSPVWPGRRHDSFWGCRWWLLCLQWTVQCQGGRTFLFLPEVPWCQFFKAEGWGICPVVCVIGFCRISRVSTRWVAAIDPTPDKPTLFQVGTDFTSSSGHIGTYVYLLVGFWLEGGMNLGE